EGAEQHRALLQQLALPDLGDVGAPDDAHQSPVAAAVLWSIGLEEVEQEAVGDVEAGHQRLRLPGDQLLEGLPLPAHESLRRLLPDDLLPPGCLLAEPLVLDDVLRG